MLNPDPHDQLATAATLTARIDACLPQTQCTRCGYPRCRAYAEAVARAEADLNRCPPGGDKTIGALAALLDRQPKPLDPRCGRETERQWAVIDEERCIGCRKCIDACPVDAIIGARRHMHTVLAQACSGCELCLPACPVDCINLTAAQATGTRTGPWRFYDSQEADNWRRRNEALIARRLLPAVPARVRAGEQERALRRAEIRAALERVRRRKQGVLRSDRQPGG